MRLRRDRAQTQSDSTQNNAAFRLFDLPTELVGDIFRLVVIDLKVLVALGGTNKLCRTIAGQQFLRLANSSLKIMMSAENQFFLRAHRNLLADGLSWVKQGYPKKFGRAFPVPIDLRQRARQAYDAVTAGESNRFSSYLYHVCGFGWNQAMHLMWIYEGSGKRYGTSFPFWDIPVHLWHLLFTFLGTSIALASGLNGWLKLRDRDGACVRLVFDVVPRPRGDASSDLERLTRLILRNCDMRTVPGCIGQCKNLRLVDMSENRSLMELPEEIAQCTRLEELYLTHCFLMAIPDDIGSLGALRILDVTRNYLQNLPASIGSCHNLAELRLAHNKMEALPDVIGQCSSLRLLCATDNRLDELPKTIGDCIQLEEFSCRENFLHAIPASLGQCTKLKLIDLGRNDLTDLPEALGQCTQLEKLLLSNNCLNELFSSIGQCKRLSVLELGNDVSELKDARQFLEAVGRDDPISEWPPDDLNRLTYLPSSIVQCVELKELDISGNAIGSLPDELGNLHQLEVLYASRNCLSLLPESICDCKNLRELLLCDNGLSIVPKNIGNLNKLESLDLSQNAVFCLPDSFRDCQSLENIDLSDNQLLEFPTSLVERENLRHLNTSGNPYTNEPDWVTQRVNEPPRKFDIYRSKTWGSYFSDIRTFDWLLYWTTLSTSSRN